MDKEHIKGAADKAKGAVKDAAGKMMDDNKCRPKAKWTRRREKPESVGEQGRGSARQRQVGLRVLNAERAALGPPFFRHAPYGARPRRLRREAGF